MSSRGPAAPTRAAAPPGGSVYCTFPTKARLPHKSQPRPSGAHARSSSSRRLCALAFPTKARLPHKSQPRPSGAHARSSSSRKFCVLRLPHESQPRPGAHARSSSSRRLCVLRLPHERQKALCTAPATRKPAAVWQGYEMSVLWWMVSDECCVISGVRWILCDEWCEMSAVRWVVVCVVWEAKTRRRGGGWSGGCRVKNKRTG